MLPVTGIPIEHIQDSQKLVADGEIDLFQLTPIGGGTVYFKGDNEVTWQGQTYEALPIAFTGLKKSTTGSATAPRLIIGDGTMDLSPFKPLAFDGYLDSATLVHFELLLDNLVNDLPIYERRVYRVKRVEEYHRMLINLQLATASDALSYTLPHRRYHPPAFPAVTIQ
jgi:phage-related protein